MRGDRPFRQGFSGRGQPRRQHLALQVTQVSGLFGDRPTPTRFGGPQPQSVDQKLMQAHVAGQLIGVAVTHLDQQPRRSPLALAASDLELVDKGHHRAVRLGGQGRVGQRISGGDDQVHQP